MIAKYIVCLFIILQSCLAYGSEERPSLRAIILCDTVSSNIKKASFVDITNMKKMTKILARELKMKRRVTLVKGKHLTKAPLENWVNRLPFSSNDIVLFYYSGHGFRFDHDISAWPTFVLGHKKNNETLVGGESIYQEIRRRAPRLAIIMFDCCNFAISSKKMIFPSKELFSFKKTKLPGIHTLFEHTRGIITITAASPGELAIAITGGKSVGSLFTSQFLRSLLQESRSSDASWEKVIQKMADKCAFVSDDTQHPLSLVEISR
jgi:hypothetical protein